MAVLDSIVHSSLDVHKVIIRQRNYLWSSPSACDSRSPRVLVSSLIERLFHIWLPADVGAISNRWKQNSVPEYVFHLVWYYGHSLAANGIVVFEAGEENIHIEGGSGR